MYYKVEKGTALFSQLIELQKRMHECDQAAFDFAKNYGFDKLSIGSWNVAGGISLFSSKINPDETLFKIYPKLANCFTVSRKTKSGKELHEAISYLPKISYGEFNKTIFGTSYHWGHPSLKLIKDKEVFILGFPKNCYEECKKHIKSTTDLIEIKQSEFLSLQGK